MIIDPRAELAKTATLLRHWARKRPELREHYRSQIPYLFQIGRQFPKEPKILYCQGENHKCFSA